MLGATRVQVPPTGVPRLSGLLRKCRLPIAHYDTWLTPLTPTGLPAAGLPPSIDDAVALLEVTESPILFRNLKVDHPVTRSLLAAATHQKIITSWQRAGLNLDGTYDAWLARNFDHKRRKELKRLRTRLGEQGKLESVALTADGDIAPFLQAFMTLEAKSWKGKRGSAVANNGQLQKALSAGLRAMHAAGRVKFWQINFDDQAIASLFALVDDGEVTLGKIAHDEAFAKSSPGVLIILDATATLMGQTGLTLADSNAKPGHPMIDRIWRDRIACMDVLLSGPATPTPMFRLLSSYTGMHFAARDKAKRVLAQWTGRKIS